MLVDWGQTPNVTEFGASRNLKMDLSLSAWSYRGVRFAWDGKPLTLPAISAQDAGNSTTIWASWIPVDHSASASP